MNDDLETVFPLPVWAVILIIAICWPSILLSGCSTPSPSPRSEVCFMHVLGQTDSGVPVVATQCYTPEAFAETQK